MKERKMNWEIEESKKTATLGQQYIDKFNKKGNKSGYQARDIINQYGLDTFSPELEDIIKKHKDYAEKYYIWIVSQDIAHFDAKKINFVVRRTKPLPKWETVLLNYNNKTGDLFINWVLPTKEGSEGMLKNTEGWDQMMINSIVENLPSLKKQQAEILRGSQKPQAQKSGLLTHLSQSESK